MNSSSQFHLSSHAPEPSVDGASPRRADLIALDALAVSSDAELIQRLGDGDLSPLGILYDRHHESVRQFIARATAGASDTDDLTHNTFLTLRSIASRFDGRSSARPLLFGIAAQLMRRRRRNLTRWAQALGSFTWTSDDDRQLTPESAAAGSQELRRFDLALSRLSEDKRLVFLLVEREGRSGEEVATALGIPVSTVWTRLHYARAELRAACAGKSPRHADRQSARAVHAADGTSR
jgi:RNA polymerase sigma-70 factor (ECF subfamily)